MMRSTKSPRRVIVAVQARTGSNRLPGKVLLPLGQRTVLHCMLKRVMEARLVDEVVVATTTLPEDREIANVGAQMGLRVTLGHPTDLLKRHVECAFSTEADVIVKVPSDCPLIDPRVIDQGIAMFMRADYDYVSNLHPPSFPDGNDVEVMSMNTLLAAYCEARKNYQREHTTPYIVERPERFRRGNFVWRTGRNVADSHRLTLDYQEDYAIIRKVYDALERPCVPAFSVEDIADYLDSNLAVRTINAAHHGTSWMSRIGIQTQRSVAGNV